MTNDIPRWYQADAGQWSYTDQERVLRWCHTHARDAWRFSRISDPDANGIRGMEVLFLSASDHVLFTMTRD